MSIVSFVVKKALPEVPYHYIGDDIISTSNWPNSGTSGSGNLTTSTGTITIVPNGVNGHKYVRLDTDQARIYSGTIPTVPSEFTIFNVIRYSQLVPHGWGTANTYGSFMLGSIRFSQDLGAGQALLVGFGAGLTNITWTGYFPTEQWMLLTFRYKNVSNWLDGLYTSQIKKNGSHIVYGTSTAYNTSGTQAISIGGNYDSFSDLDFAEFMYFPEALDNSVVSSIETYLKNKYGIS